jgi:hypothetical protein
MCLSPLCSGAEWTMLWCRVTRGTIGVWRDLVPVAVDVKVHHAHRADVMKYDAPIPP